MTERHLIGTIKKALPGVVSIVASRRLKDLERELAHEFYPFLPGRRRKKVAPQKLRIPDLLVSSDGMVEVGGGSGFIVTADGLVLTNRHVVGDRSAEYTAITNDGEKYQAHILSANPLNDVAILKLHTNRLPYVKLGDATKLELGSTVIAIGNALGLFKNTVSSGIISGLSRSISAESDGAAPPQELRGLIQTDAAINPGNSGGPLIDLHGRAIGINTALALEAQSIGFAIPINAAQRDLEDIKKHGRIRRPYLGVRYITIDKNLQEKMGLAEARGALVVQEGPHEPGVINGSPADKAGLQENDIILECNGRSITVDRPIEDILATTGANDTLHLLVERGKKRFKVSLTLTERK